MNILKLNLILLCSIFLQACQLNSPVKISVQGHRGDRGNWPENTLKAFKSAIDKGVDVIELDIVINRYDEIIVSHEPYMHSDYVLLPNGQPIHPNLHSNYNIYNMKLDSVQMYDTGSKFYSAFPKQIKIPSYKPGLGEVFEYLKEEFGTSVFQNVAFNIELKSNPKEYGKFQHYPDKMVSVFLTFMKDYPLVKYTLQSFDIQILEYAKAKKPDLTISYLVSKGSFKENLMKLSFLPDIYSPNYKLLTHASEVRNIQEYGLKVIPWTVNDVEDIQYIINLGVDEIISDYPELALSIIKASN